MEQSSVNSATEGRPAWVYTPVMQFFARFINVALIDCRCALALARISHGVLIATPLIAPDPQWRPTDAALLARDWLARSDGVITNSRRYLSFPICCVHLGADSERSRVSLLQIVDAAGDYDTDEAWARLEELSATEPEDDIEALFDVPRVVPVLDQLSLF